MRPVIRLLDAAMGVVPKNDKLGPLLIKASGSYCLFCEAPLVTSAKLPDRVVVNSHGYAVTLPTGQSGKLSVDSKIRVNWANRLLCCDACWDCKGVAPDWFDGFKIVSNGPLAGALLGELQSGKLNEASAIAIYQIAARTWMWPDSAEDGAAQGLIAFEGDDTWNMLSLNHASHSQVELEKDGLVRLSDYDRLQQWATEKQSCVWVGVGQNVTDNDATRRIQNTILGFNLNYSRPFSSDQRVNLRTAAWSQAQKYVAALEEHWKAWKRERLDEQLVAYSLGNDAALIRKAIVDGGFWTVWAKVLVGRTQEWEKIGFATWAIRSFLISVLVQYETPKTPQQAQQGQYWDENDLDDDTAYPMVIPGTDADRLPDILGGAL
jgi:hypothetical protein